MAFGSIGDTVLDLDQSFVVLVEAEGDGILIGDGVVLALFVAVIEVTVADGSDLRFGCGYVGIGI